MTIPGQKNAPSFWLKTVRLLIPIFFFFAFFLFVLLYIDPRLINVFNGVHKYSFILELTKEYAGAITAIPGGPDKLAATLIVAACGNPWLGALILTALAWMLCYTSAAFVKQSTGKSPRAVQYVPALLFLLMLCRYSMHYLPAVLAGLGMVFIAILFQRLAIDSAAKRCTVFAAFFLAAYYLFSYNAVFFAMLVVINEILCRKKTIVPMILTAAGLGLAAWVSRVFLFPFDRIFNYATILDFKRPLLYLYLSVPLCAIMYGTMHIILSRHKEKGTSSAIRSKPPFVLAMCLEYAIVLFLAGVMVLMSRDWTTRNIRELGQILYLERTCQWTEILKKRNSFLFDKYPELKSRTMLLASHAIYRALYHTGQLGSNMFSFPQAADPEPLMLRRTVWTVYFPAWTAALDVAIDLGAAGYAEKLAGEAMENIGPQPYLMYNRALLQAAKGNNELAATYCNRLKNMPGYGHRAEMLLRQVNDPGLAPDTAVTRLRLCMDKEDYVLNRVDEEGMLLSLLKTNPRNKMAFEYLMAYYLLTRQPNKVAYNAYRLDDFDYRAIPEHYEEAIEIYLHSDSTAAFTAPKLQPRSRTRQRCEQFLKTLDLYSGGVAGSEATLRSDFGTSYFYFYTFGFVAGGKR
jgi:hypothetical protein